MKKRALSLGILFSILIAAGFAQAESVDYGKLIAEKSPALVTVKFTLKISMPRMDPRESESESPGVMIDPKGLVLCSNTSLGGIMSAMERMMGDEMGGPMGEMKATPSDIKVLVGEDLEGLPAKLLARDTDLDLAWVQIKEPGDKKFEALDFAHAAAPQVGEGLILLHRLGKHHDRVPSFRETRVAALVKKPRDLIIPSTSFSNYGAPIFSEKGGLVGLAVLQPPERQGGGDPMAMMASMFSMGDMMAALILPADEVAAATKRALAGEIPEENAEPKAEPKPDAAPDAEKK